MATASATRRRKPATTTSPSLKGYEDKFLDCRLQHAFVTVGFFHTADGNRRRRLECSRCKAIGHDTFSSLGERVKPRQYNLPPGYSIEGGVELAAVRREVMKRATIFKTEADMLAAANRAHTVRRVTKPTRPRKAVKGTRKTHAVKHRARAKARS